MMLCFFGGQRASLLEKGVRLAMPGHIVSPEEAGWERESAPSQTECRESCDLKRGAVLTIGGGPAITSRLRIVTPGTIPKSS
jgi:hypothetical protein